MYQFPRNSKLIGDESGDEIESNCAIESSADCYDDVHQCLENSTADNSEWEMDDYHS